MTDQITFKCLACGHPVEAGNVDLLKDDDLIICRGCGHQFGTYAEVRAEMVKMAKKAVDDLLDQANLPKWVQRKGWSNGG